MNLRTTSLALVILGVLAGATQAASQGPRGGLVSVTGRGRLSDDRRLRSRLRPGGGAPR